MALLTAVGVSAISGTSGSQIQAPEGLVVARDGDLYAVALADGPEVRLTTTPAWEASPAVSPDGQRIVYQRAKERSTPYSLWMMNADGSQQSALRVAGTGPTWAPDGRTIYFARTFYNDNGEICASVWRTTSAGRGTQRITRGERLDTSPDVSPNGKLLALETGDCEPGFPYGIVVMRLSTRKARGLPKLPPNIDGSFEPSWSPDGLRIAFNTGLDDRARVWVARADGSAARAITRPGLFASSPEWSPDGSLIAVIGTGTGRNDDVYVLDPEGTGLRPVTRSAGREFSASWLPHMP
jgi:TolB protein